MVLGAALSISASSPAGDTAAKVVKLTDADNQHAVTLAAGDTLVVSLTSTPGTGFSWRVRRIDDHVLRQSRAPELIHRANSMPGAPATQVFRFVAAGAGSTALELDYVRPWEHGVAPARTFHLRVTVH
jgi:inhibitor of cysteine peptidase